MKKTVAVDFDGVIHAYSKGWHDGSIYDAPVPGVQDAMQRLLDRGFEVVIFSTRTYEKTIRGKRQPGQFVQMSKWLNDHKVPFTRIHNEPGKPLCVLLIDDRAYRFRGHWEFAIHEIFDILDAER